jgi:osmotically-inducible protein OsmY
MCKPSQERDFTHASCLIPQAERARSLHFRLLVRRGVAVAVLLLVAACAGNIQPNRQLDDAALAASVREAFQADQMLRASTIYVAVNRGVVTLTGTVRDAQSRDRAVAVAQGVQGVSRVENLISVQ